MCWAVLNGLALSGLYGQTGSLSGILTDDAGGLAFARVVLPELNRGTIADSTGRYYLDKLPAGRHDLKVSVLGYAGIRETVQIEAGKTTNFSVQLERVMSEMDEVVITGTKKETFVKDSPIKVEVITSRFLQLNPTSNVIEAMATVNGVQEQINCGVCGTNDIHINGMEGPYTLVMIDGMPIVSALGSVYGFNGIPTDLVDRIEIVKGPASSLYGSEAVGGVVNIITKSPDQSSGISLNSFYTSHREGNVDVSGTLRLSKRVSTLFSGNLYRNQYRLDANGDDFTDIPLTSRLSLFNKWEVKRKDDRMFNLAARYYTEDRFGGVMAWQTKDRGSSLVYGETIQTQRIELIGNYQLPIATEHIRLEYSFNYHYQDSYYGDTPYEADQSILFANLIWDKSSEKHDLLVGTTMRIQQYDDNTPATPDGDADWIPGLFMQDEMKVGSAATVLGGMRLDYHADHGYVFTPRVALKFKPSDWTTLRINSGKGFRVVNLFTEDHAALTGARNVIIEETLRPEQSYNVNVNLNHVFLMGNKGTGTVDLDAFYTYFQNKIIPDYDADPNLIVYRNLQEHAIVKGMALAIDQRFVNAINIKLGLTYQEVYQRLADSQGEMQKVQQEFAPKWSGVFAASYEFKKPALAVHLTGNVVGSQHLPTYEAPFERPEKSPAYSLMNIQLSWKPQGSFQLYGGVKNILNWTQPSPLIDPGNPFSESFDTAYAYGPLQPRRTYMGIRWTWK